MKRNDTYDVLVVWLAWLVLFLMPLAAWATHIIYCLEHGRWGFLIAGALMFPIAIIHGFLIWAGAM